MLYCICSVKARYTCVIEMDIHVPNVYVCVLNIHVDFMFAKGCVTVNIYDFQFFLDIYTYVCVYLATTYT